MLNGVTVFFRRAARADALAQRREALALTPHMKARALSVDAAPRSIPTKRPAQYLRTPDLIQNIQEWTVANAAMSRQWLVLNQKSLPRLTGASV